MQYCTEGKRQTPTAFSAPTRTTFHLLGSLVIGVRALPEKQPDPKADRWNTTKLPFLNHTGLFPYHKHSQKQCQCSHYLPSGSQAALSTLPVFVQHPVQQHLGTLLEISTAQTKRACQLNFQTATLYSPQMEPCLHSCFCKQTSAAAGELRKGARCPSPGRAGGRTHQEHSRAFTNTVTGSGKVLSHLTNVKTHKTIKSKAQVREVKACLYRKLTLKYCFQEGLLCSSQESFTLGHRGSVHLKKI